MRAGAEYWSGQRSKPNPGNCLGTPDFERGCEEAESRLMVPDGALAPRLGGNKRMLTFVSDYPIYPGSPGHEYQRAVAQAASE